MNRYYPNYYNPNEERFGFLGPFLLGGITGGLVAPLFYPPQVRPPYYNQYNTIYTPYYSQPYPYYFRNN
jgi:hypothetical protein